MAYEDVKNLSDADLDAQIAVFEKKVFAVEQQLEVDRKYLVQMKSERSGRSLGRNVGVVTDTYHYIADILSGKVVIPDLDKVYLKETINHKLDNGEEKLCIHYARAISLAMIRGKIRNYGKRDEYYIPLDTPLNGNPDPKLESLPKEIIPIKCDHAKNGYYYDDIMIVFAFYYKREGDTRKAAKKTENFMELVHVNGFIRKLAEEAANYS